MRTTQPPYLCAALDLLTPYVAVWLWLVVAVPSLGQEGNPPLEHRGHGHWRNYGIEDGLPGLDVYAVLVDREGLLWFGTDGSGVSRYDGNEFKTFTTRDGLAGNSVRSIYRTGEGICGSAHLAVE
jgi:hypothetical protein